MISPSSPEAVAVIGMAGRFPHAPDLATFWQNIRQGRECVSFFEDHEVQWLPIEKAPNLADPSYVKARAILECPEWFDAAFFGLTPREASITDPQHRVFLECAWEALENAGCNPDTYAGAIGVFAGASMNSYLFTNVLTNRSLVENIGFLPTILANNNDYLTTRVSYKLNLRGPSMNVQTACSTSLVAVCLAAQNLLSYRCDMALAGGVSITFPSHRGQYHVPGGIMSRDGHCRAFAADASGTVLGDGAGVVVLKRLSEAIADGDPIQAVIRGSAMNNDGSLKMGFTAPSSAGQAEAIAMAHAEADFAPDTISYIEAHGTATPLGDPIEIAGLTKAFGFKGERGQFCGLGSVKTNIGHLDATAGIAGFIKTVLALQARELPPSLHFDRPNPQIDFAQSPFYVVNSLRPWPAADHPRRAGVSSFGLGGTNAHVALEEAPPIEATAAPRVRPLLVLSARTRTALDTATANLAAHLETHPDLNLADVAWTLQTGRKAFAHRRVVVADDATDAARRLRDTAHAPTGQAAETAPPVIFMFPGQGAQHPGMGQALYGTEPIFRQAVDECCELLRPALGLDLRTVLFPAPAAYAAAETRLNETAFTQPALFTIEYSLARLWQSGGVQPQALIGHSLGEYVAACLAGVFSLPDALTLVAARARLMQAQPRGAMLAVRLSAAEAAAYVQGPIALAAVNAPELCVLSGPVDAIDTLQQDLTARAIGAKRLATSHAFHSAMMEPVIEPLLAEFRHITLHAPQLPCLSNVTGTWLTAAQATDPHYWATHLRHTVRFADGIATLCQSRAPVLLEVGPGQTLATLARQQPAVAGGPAPVCSLARAAETTDDRALREALGRLWIAGTPVDWAARRDDRRVRVPLPTYPFERQRYWIEPALAQTAAPTATPTAATLPSVDESAPSAPTPQESLGRQLAALFSELAGLDFTGANATRTFQELGLDSLLLTQASFALQSQFGASVPMRQLIEQFSTLEKLTAHLEAARPQAPTPAEEIPAAPEPVAAPEVLPLTQSQQEIWFASQMGTAVSAAYKESFTLDLRGTLDEAALRQALADLTARHESLRLVVMAQGEQQHIAPVGGVAFSLTDLSDVPATQKSARLRAATDDAMSEPFDLTAGPLWRVRLIRLTTDHHALVMVVHHIICDGWSQSVLLHELGELYTARRRGQPSALPAPARFSDYVRSAVAHLDSSAHAAAEAYWLGRFADGAPVLELPGDRPRPTVCTHAAGQQGRPFHPTTVAAVRQLAAQTNSTPFTVLLTAFTTLLHRTSGQDDIVVGVPAAPQVLAGWKTLVGHCVNLLPIRSQVTAGQSFADLLQATRRTTLDGFEHWEHSFTNLLRRLNVPRESNRVPLANVTFNLARHRGALRFDGLTVSPRGNAKRFVNFDINFHVIETDQGFIMDCNYSAELFDADTIARALDRYELILRTAAADATQTIHHLPILLPAEEKKILVDWNESAVDWPRHECLHELFEAQAARTPEAHAVASGHEDWTYRELDERANQIAHHLLRLGVQPETPVGVSTARTPSAIAALLGILKAGGAYVPLDPAYPAERLAYMVADSRIPVLITDRALTGPAPEVPGARQLDLHADAAAIAREPTHKPAALVQPASLAYVIYTSGSTGRPKGVALEHRNAVAFCYWARDVFSPAEIAGVLAGTSFNFDLSIFEIFATLAWGGRLILAHNALELATHPRRHEVTLVNTVPSVMAELLRLNALPTSVQTVFMAGEAVPDALAEQLLALPHLKKVYEGYGPTEDTTFSSWGLRQPGVRSNLGRVFPRTQMYLLDRHLQLVPPGVPGEIYIAGEGLARGYLNQPDLTAQKFIPHPFNPTPGARLYRTGDLARQRSDNGLLEFLGRIDHQVKIRGFRVELGEIENAVLRHPGIRQALVVVVEPVPGDKRLALYYVPVDPSSVPDSTELRAGLGRDLPDYMVPSFFIPLAEFKLNPSGKIDRHALPAPTAAPTATQRVAPRSVTEEILTEIWRDVLHTEEFGVHENFFELGGHSLLVTQVLARVQQTFSLEVPLRHAFEAPTIAEFATLIEQALIEDIKASTPEPVLPHAVPV